MDTKGKLTVLSRNRGVFMDAKVENKKRYPRKDVQRNADVTKRRFSAASSALARCSKDIAAAGTPDPNKVRGRHAPNRGCLSEARTGVKMALKRKCSAFSRALFFSSDCIELFVQSSSNVSGTSNSTTNHWVVTDAEESHHLNVCWN